MTKDSLIKNVGSIILWLSLLMLVHKDCLAISPPIFVEKEAILGQVLAYGLPTIPLSKSSKNLKVVPAYFTYKGNFTPSLVSAGVGGPPESVNQSGSGWGGAMSFTYGFSPHWGYSLVGGYISQKGTVHNSEGVSSGYTGTQLNPSGWIPAINGDYNSKAQIFSASLIFDPFKKPEGFRIPIMAGFGYTRIMGEEEVLFNFADPPAGVNVSKARVGHNGKFSFSYNQDVPGIFFAVAPQFNTGKYFRWIPFGFAFTPFKSPEKEFTVSDLTTGEQATIAMTIGVDPGAIAGGGLEVVFRPWNLSFTYLPFTASGDLETSVYTFKWTKKWGGDTEEEPSLLKKILKKEEK